MKFVSRQKQGNNDKRKWIQGNIIKDVIVIWKCLLKEMARKKLKKISAEQMIHIELFNIIRGKDYNNRKKRSY